MRVYKISTGLTDRENREIVKNITEQDAHFLSSLDIKSSVDLLDDDDKITTIMVTNVINLEKLKTYLLKTNIDFNVEDITESFSDEKDEDELNQILENITQEDILKAFGIEI